MYGSEVTGNVVAGNTIGLSAAGSALGNVYGVLVQGGAHDNRIGGTAAERNVISASLVNGVMIVGAGTSGNAVVGNSIFSNAGPGIELNGNGVSGNDLSDADSGPNGYQNFPGIGVVTTGSTSRITGSLSSTPNTTFTLDFYANATADPSGNGEGERYLGAGTVTTDADGFVAFDMILSASTAAGEIVTATATDPAGNTSEFSSRLPVAVPDGPYTVVEGSTAQLDASGSFDPDGVSGLTYEWDLDGDGIFGESGTAAGRGDETGATPTFSAAGLDGPSTFPVVLRVTENTTGLSVVTGLAITITNVAPTALGLTLSAQAIDENGSTLLSGSFTDPGTLDTHTVFINWGDGNSQSVSLAAGVLNFSGISHQYLDNKAGNAPYTVTVTVADKDGGSTFGTAAVTVLNVAPTPAITSISSVRLEGTSIAVTGSATDPGTPDTINFAWAVYKDGAAAAYATGAGAGWSFTPNDNGSYRVVLTATDKDGASTSAEQTVSVANVAPTPTITGPGIGHLGFAATFQAIATDPSPVDSNAGFTYSWSVTRNGLPVNLSGISTTGSAFTFVPTEVETYSVSVRVTDKDGGSSVVTKAISVTAVAGATLLGGRLIIVGTDAADKILVNPGGGALEIKVKLNNDQQTFVGVSETVIYALGGNDDVQIAGGIRLPVTVFGGSGNDRIKGGGGNSVLVGGDGDDLLIGGSGRNILIGGDGADRIQGSSSDDLLIAGSTAFDLNLGALNLIGAEWFSDRSFTERVGNLSGTGTTRVNGPVFLAVSGPNATVFDDHSVDTLSGDAGTDWFLFNRAGNGTLDQALDINTFEASFAEDLSVFGPFVG